MRRAIPRFGDRRLKSGFLWFPKCVRYEMRWWEYAVWREYYNGVAWEEIDWMNP